MEKYKFRFKENQGSFIKEMLETLPEGWGMYLRSYLEYGNEKGVLIDWG